MCEKEEATEVNSKENKVGLEQFAESQEL